GARTGAQRRSAADHDQDAPSGPPAGLRRRLHRVTPGCPGRTGTPRVSDPSRRTTGRRNRRQPGGADDLTYLGSLVTKGCCASPPLAPTAGTSTPLAMMSWG